MEPVPFVRLLSMAVALGLDDLHGELERRGHGGLRPVHGFALNAILNGCRTASDLAPRLGMTKQGAAKVLQHLAAEGYVTQEVADGGDARRKPVRLTPRGRRAIALAVEVQDRIEDQWAAAAGRQEAEAMRTALERIVRSRSLPSGELPPARPTW